jgi:hypothetical protein
MSAREAGMELIFVGFVVATMATLGFSVRNLNK